MLFAEQKKKEKRVALCDVQGSQMTYKDLDNRTSGVKELLTKRSLLLLVCNYSMETVSFYYSALQIGIVPILLESNCAADHIEKICEKYHPRYLWCREDRSREISILTGKTPLISVPGYALYEFGWESYEIHPDLALLLTTSGSTGSAKMVRISYRNLEHNADIMKKVLQISPDDRGITSLPMHHCFGLSLLHVLWSAGASVFLYDGTVLNPTFLKTVSDHRITVTFFVPYNIELLKMTDYNHSGYDNFRCILLGGGKQDDASRNFWRDFCLYHGITSVFGYGQTEGTCYLAGIPSDLQKSGDNIGVAPEGLSAYLKDKDNRGIGELVIEGECVSLGYADGYDDLRCGDENKGVLHTGDLAYIDPDRNIYIKGRVKRIVKLLGERISLDEVEDFLRIRFPESIFACIDLEDKLLVVYNNSSLNEADISKALEREMNIHKRMLTVIFAVEIPRMANGKIDYAKLRRLIRHG